MTWFLLDTNHLSDAIKPVSRVRDRVQSARLEGHVFGICVPVLCELEVGLQQLRNEAEFRRRLSEFSRHLQVWPLGTAIPGFFARMSLDLRGRGRVLSPIDIMLAALTRSMNLTLLTGDRDFEALPDIRIENWLVEPAVETS